MAENDTDFLQTEALYWPAIVRSYQFPVETQPKQHDYRLRGSNKRIYYGRQKGNAIPDTTKDDIHIKEKEGKSKYTTLNHTTSYGESG